MKQLFIGTFYIGFEQVDIYLLHGDGGELYALPAKGQLPRIKLGADVPWEKLHATLVHEALEMIFMRNKVRYTPMDDMGNDLASVVFAFSHPVFSDCCAKLADFLNQATEPVKKAHKRWSKK